MGDVTLVGILAGTQLRRQPLTNGCELVFASEVVPQMNLKSPFHDFSEASDILLFANP